MLELLLRVETDGGKHSDVSVELVEHHRVIDLALAAARHLGVLLPDGHLPSVACQRLGDVLDPEALVVDSGLVSGDLVRLGVGLVVPGASDATAVDAGGGLFCDVVSGPSSGTSLPLQPGRFTVGRDHDCDLVLADPTVSKRHLVLTVVDDGRIAVEPVHGATNPVVVDGTSITGRVALRAGSVVQLGGCAVTVRQLPAPAVGARDQLGQIPFNRTPYRHPDLRPVEVRGPGTPPKPFEPRPMMLAMLVLPLVGGLAFALILERWYFLLFAVLSPLAMLVNWWSERRRGGATHRQQVATFERRFADWLSRYDAALLVERRRRHAAAPDVADLARRAELRTADLWPRTRWSLGFLDLRLGLGSMPALTGTRRPDGVDADPDARIGDAIDQRSELPSVPVTVDLFAQGVVAVHGPASEVESSAAALVIQAAVLHSPEDLVVCSAQDRRRTLGEWVKWLPHTRSVTSPLDGAHVASGADEADDLLRRLLAVVADREADAWPRILCVLDELVGADPLLVAALLEAGPAAGVVTLWVGQEHARVPRQATAILAFPPLVSGERAHLWSTDPSVPTRELDPDRIGARSAAHVARCLAPVRDASSASAAASIPRVAPLLETLRAPALDADAVARSWQERANRYGLEVPIGIGPSGPLVVDLVEHGPHGLIAGTSGAGKSELLQSLIAGLVVRYPPTRLNLLFIDYKGGASSNAFQQVPHNVGSVTNLGVDTAMRALVSLRAELDRRMRLLEGRAKDMAEMLARSPEHTPPSLVIVVDEFATLVKEIPDFVAGMVDVAQRGRSLGIHLILATQRPAGAVNDDILANANLRIGLRMLDPGESSSILGTDDAASIPAPLRGRGFARLGTGGLVEFQAAYAGAPFRATDGIVPVTIGSFPPDLATTPEPAREPAAREERSHLDVLLDAVVAAGAAHGVEPARRPWLEDLPAHIDLSEVLDGAFGEPPTRVPGRDVVIGVLDEPRHQRQRPCVIDLEEAGGLLAFGTGGSGRTTLLRTVVASAVQTATPAEVQVHVLDFAGRGLESLRDLPHVAAVAPGDDLEQTTRVVMYLRAEVARRQRLVAEARAGDLTALNATRPDEPMPRLLLLVDGYEGFQRAFERTELYPWTEMLVATVLAGRSVGLHLVATADRRVSVPAPLSNAIGGRVILRTVDADALIDLGVPVGSARHARLGDGRALLPDGTRLQVAVAGTDASAAGQSAELTALARATSAGGSVALPDLPSEIRGDRLPSATGAWSFVLGVADLDLEPVVCDVRSHHLAVIGPSESGRSTALRTAARGLADAGHEVWVLADGSEGPLAADPWPKLATRREEHPSFVEEIVARVRSSSSVPVLVIDRAESLDDGAAVVLETVLRDAGIRLLVGLDVGTATGYAAGWLGQLKDTRRKLILQPDDIGDLSMITSSRPVLRPDQAFPPGRGILVSSRNAQLLQVAS